MPNISKLSLISVIFFSLSLLLLADNQDVSIERISWKEADTFVPRGSHYVYRVNLEIPHMNQRDLKDLLYSKTFLEQIPYYSQYNEATSNLYDSVFFSGSSIRVEMSPFKPFSGEITFFQNDTDLNWTYRNTDTIKYSWFSVVSAGNMVTYIAATHNNDILKISGLAAIKTFPFLHLFGKRIDDAVEGRILAIFYALAESTYNDNKKNPLVE